MARGGIRIIRSQNETAYHKNVVSLVDENYNLAATQQLKNKDIPEGGSKGTILVNCGSNHRAEVAFMKYIDSLLDLMLVGQSPGIKDAIVDKYGKEEILFLGPDEGTANLMDWASQHARKRNASFWNSFTTGKSPSLGGIPHDQYGMTTRSVHQYVVGMLRKLNLKEENVRKLQTGGPDGDLGSNEIKISKDKTIAIVDGSGVLYDPNGIDRPSILELANKRQMIEKFDISKLSSKGFRVLIGDKDVKLPDGNKVISGLMFRNDFHLNPYATECADIFVPCGGRPESVNVGNVQQLLHKDGSPKFKYIVEGANLFFSPASRKILEDAGAILFRDATANKGGVTSSSLEVFAGLSMSDDFFNANMQVKGDGIVPEFYKNYVLDVQTIIERNARNEFECIWREQHASGKSRLAIADQLSTAIVTMSSQLEAESKLWGNLQLRKKVIESYCPPTLVGPIGIGIDNVLKNTPESYLKAIFGAYLASNFVYEYGLNASPFSFFDFIQKYM